MYDHNVKAGNQGDVVKHSALIAAADSLLHQASGTFHYADIFSGYAFNPLKANGEWRLGIGKLESASLQTRNSAISFWRQLWLCKTGLRGSIYPGSSCFVLKLCLAKNRQYHARLWDTSPTVISQLMNAFESNEAEIFPRSATLDDFSAKKPDLLLIDPPGLKTAYKKDYPDLEYLLKYFNEVQNTILWYPITAAGKGSPASETSPSIHALSRCLDFGLRVTSVRWSRGIRTCGCRLAYRLPHDAGHQMRETVDEVAGKMQWQVSHE